ncbi:MAG: beta strand repeat-containing protein, partial [Bacteroidota bacterium]
VGTVLYAGGTGASGTRQLSGGGGGGAGSLGAGNAASGITGGAARANNGGAGGNGSNANSANGLNGSVYGAGGGGATRSGVPGSGAPGLVIVSWSCSVSLTSAIGTDAQTICVNAPIIPITYQFSGVTGATVSGLPTGVSSSYNTTTNVLTISGTPVVFGTFNYAVAPVGGCTGTTASGSITVANPTVSTGAPLSAICQGGTSSSLGGSVSGGATGGVWSDGGVGGSFSPAATNLNATYTPPAAFTGTVTLTLTSTGGGCASVSASKTLTVNPAPSASISYAGSPYCSSVASATCTLVGTTGGVFSVAPAGITINSSSGSFSPASSIPGTYTVTYSITASGCNFSTSTSVVVKAVPQTGCTAAGIINCSNSSSVLSAGATASTGNTITGYSWSPGGATTATISVTNGSPYTVTVTQSNGCAATCSISAVVDTCKPTVSIASSGGSCSGTATSLVTTATVCPGNSLSYSWNTGATTSSLTTSTAGTYTVTVSQNINGCTASASSSVSAASTPIVVTASASPIACNGGTSTVLVSASGGTPAYTGTGSFTVNAGTYTYVVTDATGCTGSTSITVSQPAVLTATAAISSPIVCFGGAAVVTVNASGGTAPYSGTGPLSVSAGTAAYTVTDARGCTATTGSLTITQPSQLLITVTTTPTNCGSFIGTASASASGGVSPYTYSWSNGQSGQNATNLGGGTYIVTVTDAIGCSATASALIGVNGGSPIGITGPIIGPPGACLKSFVTYSVDPVSGASGYTWTLPFGASGTSSSNAISVYFDSTYAGGSICVTPSNPCVQGNTVCINVPAITTKPAQPGTVTVVGNICGPDTLTVSVSPVAFTTNYVWSVSGTQAVIVGGQGTTSARIAIPAGFTNTQLGIQAFNCLGSSAIKYQTLVGKPVINTGLTGPTILCPNTTQSYSVGVALGATSYSWSITGDAIIQSSNNNNCVVQTGAG